MMANVRPASKSSVQHGRLASDVPPEIAYGYVWLHDLVLLATGLDLDETQVAFTTRVAERKLTDLFDVAEEVALANGRQVIFRHDLPLTKGLRRTIQQTAALTKELEADPAAVFKTWAAPNIMVDEMLRAELPRLTTAMLVLTGQVIAALEPADRPGGERDQLLVRTDPDRPSPWELERAERVLALTL